MENLHKISSLLHILICSKPHDYNHENIGMVDGKCRYYAEEQLTTCWEEPDHIEWMKLGKDFTQSCGLEIEEEGFKKAIILLEDIRDACKKIAFLTLNCPLTTPYITAILSNVMKPGKQEPLPAPRPTPTTTSVAPRTASGVLNVKELLD